MIDLHILRLAILQTLGQAALFLPLFLFINMYYEVTKSEEHRKISLIAYGIEELTIYALAISLDPSMVWTAITYDIMANVLTQYILKKLLN